MAATLLFLFQRIPLDFLQGDKFHEAADNYIRPLLTKVFIVAVQAILIDFFLFFFLARIMYDLLVVLREFLHYSQIFHHYTITLERRVLFLACYLCTFWRLFTRTVILLFG